MAEIKKEVKKEVKPAEEVKAKDEKTKNEDIVIDKETLKELMSTVKNLKKDNEILMQSADKRALARYYARHREDLPPVMRLRTMNGKIIVGWKLIEDKGSYQIPGTGRWTESQTVELYYQDGTEEKMAEMDFERKYEKNIKVERIAVTIDDKTGKEALRVRRLDNDEELTIGVQFVN